MSFDIEILLSHLDAEYRIELDQYKEESDSDVSDTEDANAQLPGCPIARLPDCPIARLPNCPIAQATSEECEDSYFEVARPRRSHHHWEDRLKPFCF